MCATWPPSVYLASAGAACAIALVAFAPRSNAAEEPRLTISIGGVERTFTRSELLARKDLAKIEIPDDVAFKRPSSFEAVPLANLLEGLTIPPESALEITALDGFASQLPIDLALNRSRAKSVAHLAIERPEKPWPSVSGKQISPAPFYLTWTNRAASQVREGLWPYRIMKIASVDAPSKRWPAIGVDPKLPASHPVRWGQALFVKNCMTCHTLNGAGSASIGPDMNLPMNPVEYLTPKGLRAIVRNPRAVRTWPDQKMTAFPPTEITDLELDQLEAYLAHMAKRKAKR